MLRSVSAKFGNYNQPYTYFVPEGDDPQVGDMILTSLQWNCSYPEVARVARIVDVHPTPSGKASKFYLQLFKKEEFDIKAEQNRALAEKAQISFSARMKLEKMLADTDKMTEYRRLAETNPEAAELIKLL